MATEYLDKTGFAYFWGKLKALLSAKQDTLTQGTGISISGTTISNSGVVDTTWDGSTVVDGTTAKLTSNTILDIGSTNAQLLSTNVLANSATPNSSYFSGTVKYDAIGGCVCCAVNVTTLSAQSTNRSIVSGAVIPSGYRPSSVTYGYVRSFPSARLRISTGGYLYLDYNETTIPSGTTIQGEVFYYL